MHTLSALCSFVVLVLNVGDLDVEEGGHDFANDLSEVSGEVVGGMVVQSVHIGGGVSGISVLKHVDNRGGNGVEAARE